MKQNKAQHRVGISLHKFQDAQDYQEEMILLLGELVGCAVVKTQASFSWNKKQRDSTEELKQRG